MIRRLTSKHDEDKRKKKNQIVVGVVLVFLMLLSTLGYSFGTNLSQQNQQGAIVNYNGYEFSYFNGLWSLNIGGTIFSFINSPATAFKTNSTLKSLTNYYGKPLYIYSENAEAEAEISRNLFGVSEEITPACIGGATCGEGIQIKTCEDNFIIIKETKEASISQENGCIFLYGPPESLTRVTDGFLLKIIGVN